MRNKHLGLKGLLETITSTETREGLFNRFAPHAEIDWSLGPREQNEAIMGAFESPDLEAERIALVGILADIAEVCADQRTADRLFLRTEGNAEGWADFVSGGKRPLQEIVCWLVLHDAPTWHMLLATAKAHDIRTKSVDEYDVEGGGAPDNEKCGELATAFSRLLKARLQRGEHIHLSPVSDGKNWLYFMSVNKYPTNVQHFDERGRYGISWDKTAENFLVEYGPDSGLLRLKSDFPAPLRRVLAEVFARTILNAHLAEGQSTALDLSRHLQGQVLPRPKDKRIVAVTISAMSVGYLSARGEAGKVSLTTEDNANMSERMRVVLKSIGVSPEKAKVLSVEYRFGIYKQRPLRYAPPSVYRGKIDTKGVRALCRDREVAEIIRAYLLGVVR